MPPDTDLALLPPLRKISRSRPLAVPLMRHCYLTDSIFHPIIPHFTLSSLSHKFIYVCQLCSLPHFCYCCIKENISFILLLYLAPLDSENQLVVMFTFKSYIQVLTPVAEWWRALLWSFCPGCGFGVAACLWHSGWIREHPSVCRGFAHLPVIRRIW